MADQGPQRKRGKYKTWTLDPNLPIPKTTKWRLSSRQSTTSTDEEYTSLSTHEVNNSINDSTACDESVSLNIDHEALSEAEDGADSLPLPTAALETDIDGIQVFVNREVELSDVEQLSSEEESSFESGSESELEEVETDLKKSKTNFAERLAT